MKLTELAIVRDACGWEISQPSLNRVKTSLRAPAEILDRPWVQPQGIFYVGVELRSTARPGAAVPT